MLGGLDRIALGTRQTPVPTLMRRVTAAAAISATNGSIAS